MIALSRLGRDGYNRGLFLTASSGRGIAFSLDVAIGAIRAASMTAEDPICFISDAHAHLGFRITRFTGDWPLWRFYGRLFGRSFDRWIGG